MDLAYFIQHYGYLTVAIGSFFEGEAVLLAGSVAAYHGHLALPAVLMVSALFSFLGDLPYFFGGRRYGPGLLARYPSLQARNERVSAMLTRHHVLLVLSLRFLYGLRIAGLVALGISRMSPWRFLILDFIGAVVWAGVFTAAGYGVGRVLDEILAHIDTPTAQVTSLIALLVASSLLIIISRRRRMLGRTRGD